MTSVDRIMYTFFYRYNIFLISISISSTEIQFNHFQRPILILLMSGMVMISNKATGMHMYLVSKWIKSREIELCTCIDVGFRTYE